MCVCVMKKCLDEIAGLDTTVVNKRSSVELSITLDSNYDHVNGNVFQVPNSCSLVAL